MENHSDQIVKSNDVIGKSVFSDDNENLGKIEEIVLDKISGQARYLVLSCGGVLSIGNKLYAIPWKSISYNEEKSGFRLNFDKEKLKFAPNFDKDHWPDFADPAFSKVITDFYA